MRAIRSIILFLLVVVGNYTHGQMPETPTLPSLPTAEIDSNYLDVRDTDWSIRAFGTFKMQGVFLASRPTRTRLLYAPLALYSVGLGITYRYLTVDFGVNPFSTSDVDNSRFALAAGLTMPRSIIDFSLYRYKGYQLRNQDIGNEPRSDIRNFVLSLNHLYLFNLTRVNMMKILQGGSEVKRGAHSLGAGAFFNYHQVNTDSTLVPPVFQDDFNDFGLITSTRFFQTGLLAGFTQVVNLPEHFFFVVSATPGFGFNIGNVKTDDLSYAPAPWVIKLLVKSGIGYSGEKHYYILSLTLNGNYVNIKNDNVYAYTSGQVKFVMGFRIKKRIRQLDKIMGN